MQLDEWITFASDMTVAYFEVLPLTPSNYFEMRLDASWDGGLDAKMSGHNKQLYMNCC